MADPWGRKGLSWRGRTAGGLESAAKNPDRSSGSAAERARTAGGCVNRNREILNQTRRKNAIKLGLPGSPAVGQCLWRRSGARVCASQLSGTSSRVRRSIVIRHSAPVGQDTDGWQCYAPVTRASATSHGGRGNRHGQATKQALTRRLNLTAAAPVNRQASGRKDGPSVSSPRPQQGGRI